MFIKDPFLHSTMAKEPIKRAILKEDIIGYDEHGEGTMLMTRNQGGVLIAMPYDEVKAALTVTVC